ncbi:MAG: hypothetical protein M1829_006622 [Trizodia sp. TS-e1964]|nr:MAG: hypothetical protein M1829_006622 [Trizodia sp. TS-e1964]
MSTPPSLPIHESFTDADDYVKCLLSFASSSRQFQLLCGGIHILDFLTSTPDLYAGVLPREWRSWFSRHDMDKILTLLLRDDPKHMCSPLDAREAPPITLVEYIQNIRLYSLNRAFHPAPSTTPVSGNISIGMKDKKKHEVEHFAGYVHSLAAKIKADGGPEITHFVDFGSGKNYLGRTLASPPYRREIIAVESQKQRNERAASMDVQAKVTKKLPHKHHDSWLKLADDDLVEMLIRAGMDKERAPGFVKEDLKDARKAVTQNAPSSCKKVPQLPNGSITYLERQIVDGDLSDVINIINSQAEKAIHGAAKHRFGARALAPHIPDLPPIRLMTLSIHSCGNLSHHALRSLVVNPEVQAVAVVGCCYNLMTERLVSQSRKVPRFRAASGRPVAARDPDPDGFPISHQMEHYLHPHGQGITFLNIIARMMAVQAPFNWTPERSNDFFTRHFYRALLQRLFLDRGVILPNPVPTARDGNDGSCCPEESSFRPIVIGSLRKPSYESFPAYVQGVMEKFANTTLGECLVSRMGDMTAADLGAYEENYKARKKDLSIVWTLMALSAGVVESMIAVDRWLYLRERKEIKECWVETVFDYQMSPRNLVVVGVKHPPQDETLY